MRKIVYKFCLHKKNLKNFSEEYLFFIKMVVPSTFRPPESTIRHEQSAVRAVMDKEDLGLGTLYVTESLLSWQGAHGFSFTYPNITLHALSSDVSIYPTKCLYMLIDGKVDPPGMERFRDSVESNDENGDEDDEENVTQVLFVPEDLTELPAIYEAIKDCQALNSVVDDDSEEEMFQDADDDNSYYIDEADLDGGGDAEINRLSDRIQYSFGTNMAQDSGNNPDWEDEEFKDAD